MLMSTYPTRSRTPQTKFKKGFGRSVGHSRTSVGKRARPESNPAFRTGCSVHCIRYSAPVQLLEPGKQLGASGYPAVCPPAPESLLSGSRLQHYFKTDLGL